MKWPLALLALSMGMIVYRAAATNSVTLNQTTLSNVTPVTLKVYEPHERTQTDYVGYPTRQVLDQLFGPAWHQAEVVIFRCSDGYESPVPRAKLEAENSLL